MTSTPTPCFQCKTRNICINILLKCDGMDDCGDYSDEKNCTCGSATFVCDNGRCIPKTWVCDEEDDCHDNSDERNCTIPKPCKNNGGCDHFCYVIKNANGIPTGRKCLCKTGYNLENDGETCADPCQKNNGGCNHFCHLTKDKNGNPTGRKCICKTGYYLRTDGKTCVDLDECSLNKGICEGNCINTAGSYECKCASGFVTGKGTAKNSCIDINECDTKNGGCEHLCHNTRGGSHCSCKKGYVPSGRNAKYCNDIDECFLGIPHCHFCINEPGGFTCKCDQGYHQNANKTACVDKNECANSNGGCEHICHNKPGSYECRCKQGFMAVPTGSKSCRDINECAGNDGQGPCNHKCINGRGTYKCVCHSGYKLGADDHTCEDVDECLLPNKNSCDQICVNTKGGYYCMCRQGFFLAKNGVSCRDTIDYSECGLVDEGIAETKRWENTKKNNWPWVVYFSMIIHSYAFGTSEFEIDMSGVMGVILSEKWVLTAGHSFGQDGSHNVRTNDRRTFEVADIIPYSFCDVKKAQCKNDIALVKLAKPIKFTKNVRPICIPDNAKQQSFLQNRSESAIILRVQQKMTGLPGDLQKRTVRIRKSRDCSHHHFHKHMICAGDLRKVCTGDSGSPLMFTRKEYDSNTHTNRNKYKFIAYLGGVLSWGRDNYEQESCNSDPRFLAFTNIIGPYLKWIQDKTGIKSRE